MSSTVKVRVARMKNSPNYYLEYVKNGKKIRQSTKSADRALADRMANDLQACFTMEGYTGKPVILAKADASLSKVIDCYRAGLFTCSGCHKDRVTRVKKTLIDHFGDCLASRITTKEVQRFIESRQRNGNSSTTIRNELVILKVSFKKALEARLIDRVPYKLDRLPKARKCKERVLAPEELGRLIKESDASTVAGRMVLLCGSTGIRLGDMVTITWENIDITAKLLRYRNSKTGTMIEVPLLDDVITKLSLVKPNDNRKRVADTGTIKAVDGLVRRECKRILGRFIGSHELRRSFATILGRDGVNPRDIQAFLGHSSLTMTLEYVQSGLASKRNAIASLDTALGMNNRVATRPTKNWALLSSDAKFITLRSPKDGSK